MANALQRDDHVYRFTRHLAVIIIPFLLLFLFPQAMIAVRLWADTAHSTRRWSDVRIAGIGGIRHRA
jgi:hypothetical protein